MKNWISTLLIICLGVSLSACSTATQPVPDSSKPYIGLFTGAVAGGLAGSAINQKGGGRVRSIALGAVIGALVGYGLGLFIENSERDSAQAMSPTKPNYSKAAANDRAMEQQASSNWQRTPDTMTATVSEPRPVPLHSPKPLPVVAAAKPIVVEQKPAVEKIVAQKKPSADKLVAEKKPVADKLAAEKKVSTDKPASASDKVTSLLHKLPSMQWFVNDGKQEDIG